jgi:hypothetical protein
MSSSARQRVIMLGGVIQRWRKGIVVGEVVDEDDR